MSQCVPNWVDDSPNPNSQILLSSSIPHAPMSDYDVTELTWENGHMSTHSLNHHRINKPTPKYPSSETLEAIVNQAKLLVPKGPPWKLTVGTASAIGSCTVGKKRTRGLARGGGSRSMDDSTWLTDTFGTDDVGGGGSGLMTGSPETENTSFCRGGARSKPLTVADDYDSACHWRGSPSQSQRDAYEDEDEEKVIKRGTIRSTISTKRSRAAVHNQSERKRRDRINQRMRTLQKLVPNSSKSDKASMLDEAIDYLKQLQAQVQMMSMMGSMPLPAMMMPMQQFQMSVMAQMAQMQMAQMGMAPLARPTVAHAGISPVLPASAFLPPVVFGGSWGPSGDRMQQPNGTVLPDHLSAAFVTGPTQQPVAMDAYQRMTGLDQQLFQQAPPKNP